MVSEKTYRAALATHLEIVGYVGDRAGKQSVYLAKRNFLEQFDCRHDNVLSS
jgi:hypothetical protein